MPAGRPSKYQPSYCEGIVQFFTRKLVEIDSEGEKAIAALPTMEGYAASIAVNPDSLVEWGKQHEEFSAAIKRAKALQADMLANGGLRGIYKETMSIFLLKNNHGYTDKVETKLSGEVGLTVNLVRFSGNGDDQPS